MQTIIRLLTTQDSSYLNNVAEDVFDDPIVESSAKEFLADPRHRLVVALDNDLVVGFVSAVIYVHPDKPAPMPKRTHPNFDDEEEEDGED